MKTGFEPMRISREQLDQWIRQGEDQPLSEHLIPTRDYTGLAMQDAQIRLWLPDQARIGLEEVCARTGLSITAYLTEFFASYLYGVHELMRMRDAGSGLYAESGADEGSKEEEADALPAFLLEDEDGPDFDDPVPEMGKNIFALKIFVPREMKAGLTHRANISGVPLGRFLRAMICAHLFGRSVGVGALMGHAGC